jgi:hypothetical protein
MKEVADPSLATIPKMPPTYLYPGARKQFPALLSRCTQIGSSALSVQGGDGKLDEFDTLKL